jgi:hypothetical protein
VKISVLLARPDLYNEMNEAYAEFFHQRKAGSKRWSRLSEQIFRVDKWSLCRG